MSHRLTRRRIGMAAVVALLGVVTLRADPTADPRATIVARLLDLSPHDRPRLGPALVELVRRLDDETPLRPLLAPVLAPVATGAAGSSAEALLLAAGVKLSRIPGTLPRLLHCDPDVVRGIHRSAGEVAPDLTRGYLATAGVPAFYTTPCLPSVRLHYVSKLRLRLPSLPFTSKSELTFEVHHRLTVRRSEDGTLLVHDEVEARRPDETQRRPSRVEGSFRLSPWTGPLDTRHAGLPTEVHNAASLFVQVPPCGETSSWEGISTVAFPPNPLGLGTIDLMTRTSVEGLDPEFDPEGHPLLVLDQNVRNTRAEAAGGRHFNCRSRLVVDRRGILVRSQGTGEIRRRLFFLLPWVTIPFETETVLIEASEE